MNATANLQRARAAKKKAREVFSALVGEVAIGIAPLEEGLFGLKVNLSSPPDPNVTLPKDIDGVPVRVEVIDDIRKL